MKNKLYGIFGVVFLLLSLAGSYYLVTQNADNRNMAQIPVGTCKCEKGGLSINGTCNSNGGCKCPDGYSTGAARCDEKNTDETLPANNKDSCDKSGGFWCGGCGGFCTSGKTKTCDTAIIEKCNEYPIRGALITGFGATCTGTKCTCNNNIVCFNRGTTSQCGTPDDKNGLCAVWQQAGSPTSLTPGTNDTTQKTTTYYCPNEFIGTAGGGQSCLKLPPSNFDISCYCGTIQVDTPGVGFHSESMKCGCDNKSTDKPKQTPTPTKKLTATPTKPVSTLTPTLTPTISGTVTPTNTPTLTVTPSPTNTPGPTNTPAYLGCGYTPCDNGGNQCNSGLTCITANNSNQYCSKPELTETCKINPGYVGCCTRPTDIVNGPSPTRIVLPVSGFEFPVQALTIIGGITTLLGFLILL
jgi:hypothetical protein